MLSIHFRDWKDEENYFPVNFEIMPHVMDPCLFPVNVMTYDIVYTLLAQT
jgi:hypothetical protein